LGEIGFGKQRLIYKIVHNTWKDAYPLQRMFSFNDLLYIVQEMQDEEGKQYLENKGMDSRGFKIFRGFVEYCLYRNIANFDTMLLLTAEKGLGKSSAAIMMAREWCRLLGIRFDPKRHIAYNNADVTNKIEMLQKFEPLIADEAVRFALSEEWSKRENKELKKKLAQVRTKHLFYILCFPLKIEKVEKNYLHSFVNYWIDIIDRGLGVIYVKDKNPSRDSWRIKEFAFVGSYTEFTSVSAIRNKLKADPNFWQIIRFPKPPKWLYNRYLAVREKNIYDDDNILHSVSKLDIYNALLVLSLRDIMLHDATLTMNRILLHIKNEYDITLSKTMMQIAIEDAKQLVEKVKDKVILLND